MKTVNPSLVSATLAGLTGLADDDEVGEMLFTTVDPNDQTQVKQVIRKYLKPDFVKGGHAYQQGIKTSLAYYLTTDRIDFERVYDSCLLPFNPPTPARLFFEWVWQEFFPKDHYLLDKVDEYREKDDIYEPTRLFMKRLD